MRRSARSWRRRSEALGCYRHDDTLPIGGPHTEHAHMARITVAGSCCRIHLPATLNGLNPGKNRVLYPRERRDMHDTNKLKCSCMELSQWTRDEGQGYVPVTAVLLNPTMYIEGSQVQDTCIED